MFWKKKKVPDELTNRVLKVAADVLLAQGIDRAPDLLTPLGEEGLGLSSLGIIELLHAVEKELNVTIPERYWDSRGIASLEKLLSIVSK